VKTIELEFNTFVRSFQNTST